MTADDFEKIRTILKAVTFALIEVSGHRGGIALDVEMVRDFAAHAAWREEES